MNKLLKSAKTLAFSQVQYLMANQFYWKQSTTIQSMPKP